MGRQFPITLHRNNLSPNWYKISVRSLAFCGRRIFRTAGINNGGHWNVERLRDRWPAQPLGSHLMCLIAPENPLWAAQLVPLALALRTTSQPPCANRGSTKNLTASLKGSSRNAEPRRMRRARWFNASAICRIEWPLWRSCLISWRMTCSVGSGSMCFPSVPSL